MNHQFVACGAHRVGRHADRMGRRRVARQRDVVEPRCGAVDARRRTAEQIRHEALALREIGEHIAVGRIQHARAESQFPARRDRRRDPELRGDLACDRVDARQPAEQRHDGRAVLGHREHGRLDAFVRERGRDAADHDAGRAQRDDRQPARIQFAQMRAEFVEAHVRVDARCEPVHLRARIARLDASRSVERTGAEHHDRRWRHHPCHFSPGTTSSEKYGDAIGSTSSSGTMRWLAIVARST
ncbi:hypothetical protein FEP82_03488 [Burkholderia multivorans]|nr:hypothetical protein [Burkholderia multivorans]